MGKLIRSRKRGLSRRRFLAHAGLGAAALPMLTACNNSSTSSISAPPGEGSALFKHGIASGDPLSDRIMFWTRISGIVADLNVDLTLYADPGLSQAVTSATAVATAARDFTVKLDVTGLRPATTYYYQFTASGEKSAIGRTRTAPAGAVDQLRFGVVSCASLAHGYFNAYGHLAKRADIDAIVHTGDYIYEYGSGEYGDVREYEPAHEIVTLADYRMRHAQYKQDPDLMELHRQFPFITVWDDHETADNSWRDGANNHTEGEEGAWADRKAGALQAYDEWMPIRYPQPGNVGKIWRKFSYGDMADIFMLDTRIYDRDEPGSIPADPTTSAEPDRRMLGPEQMQWLLDGLSASSARWKVIGQQMVFHQWQAGDPGTTGAGLYVNGDAWDGYQAERQQIIDHLRDNAIDNVVFLSGDVHSSWCADIVENPLDLLTYNPLTGDGSVAVEFTTTSITSPFVIDIPEGQQVVVANNPHIRYTDFDEKGYVLLDLTAERAQGEYWYVSQFTEPGGTESFARGYLTVDGGNHLDINPVSGPSAPLQDPPPLAP